MNWNRTVTELGPRLFRYFRGTFNPEHSSDLVQETLIRLVKKVESGEFNSKLGSPAMLAFGIAHHVRMEGLREQRKSEIPIEELTAPMNPTSSEPAQILRAAITELAETPRQILTLLIDEELTLGEISKITGMPLNTVKSHIHRSKEILRQKVSNHSDGGYAQ